MSTKETRSPIELAHLLSLPLKALKATWSRTSHRRDMFAIVDMATHWPVVTPLYSGLEQALKVLAAHNLGIPVEVATGPGKILRIHHLGKCWDHISPEAKEILEDHWEQFTSLHSYLVEGDQAKAEVATAREFLWHLSGKGERGDGYESWRYSLIEMQELPRVSVEGMLQLWDSVLEVYVAHTRPEANRSIRGAIEWIALRVHQVWEQARFKASVEIQDGADRDKYDCEAMVREDQRWMRKYGCYANIGADVLWRQSRGIPVVPAQGPKRFEVRRTIHVFGRMLLEMIAKTDDVNIVEWAGRARREGVKLVPGQDGKGPRCETRTRLQKARWSDEAPKGSTVAYTDDYNSHRGQEILLRAYEYGYKVDEYEPKYENDEGFALWFEATKAGGPEETTIRVWRSQTPMPGRLAVEVEGDREEPAAKLTLWTLRYHEREEKGERLGKAIKATHGGQQTTPTRASRQGA